MADRPLERQIGGDIYTQDPNGGTGYVGAAQPQPSPSSPQSSTPGARAPHNDPWYTKILHSTRWGLGMVPGIPANEGEPSTPQWNPLGSTKKSSGKTSPAFDATKIKNWQDWANPNMVTDDQIMNLTEGDMSKISNSFAKQIIATRQQKIYSDFQAAQSSSGNQPQDQQQLLNMIWTKQVQPFVQGLVKDSRTQAGDFAKNTAAANANQGGLPSSVSASLAHNDQIASTAQSQLADAMAQQALMSPQTNDLITQIRQANTLRQQQIARLIAAQSLGGGTSLDVSGIPGISLTG